MTTSQAQTITSASTAAARSPKSTLGKDDFLSLLVAQMRHQDPLSPMEGADFAAQLAQFSSLEQLTNINTSLDQSLTANALLTSSINNALSATFIGKEVRALGDSFSFNGAGEVKLGYALASDAETVAVRVLDEAGNVVRTMDGATASGQNSIQWDGKNDQGVTVGSGKYTFDVIAKDNAGTLLNNSTYVFGKVAGVRFKSDGTVFVIDGAEIPLANIVEIMQG